MNELDPDGTIAELLDEPVRGSNLDGATLREVLGGRRTLFAFLRHFG